MIFIFLKPAFVAGHDWRYPNEAAQNNGRPKSEKRSADKHVASARYVQPTLIFPAMKMFWAVLSILFTNCFFLATDVADNFSCARRSQ